jgi:DedD protein
LAQDDYYYEIQLTNKQLVFYFLAGATCLILSFLAGVMVGRGVDQATEVQAAQPVREDRIVAEESPKPASSPLTQDLAYAQRLEGDKGTDALESGKTPVTLPDGSAAAKPAAVPSGKPSEKPVAQKPSPKPSAKPSDRASPSPAATPSAAPPEATDATPASAKSSHPAAAKASGAFTIQVGAFKDKATADSIVGRLKSKGFAAYVVAPEGSDGGLYNVRVGHYAARADAERVQTKLRDDEKFKPFIVKG